MVNVFTKDWRGLGVRGSGIRRELIRRSMVCHGDYGGCRRGAEWFQSLWQIHRVKQRGAGKGAQCQREQARVWSSHLCRRSLLLGGRKDDLPLPKGSSVELGEFQGQLHKIVGTVCSQRNAREGFGGKAKPQKERSCAWSYSQAQGIEACRKRGEGRWKEVRKQKEEEESRRRGGASWKGKRGWKGKEGRSTFLGQKAWRVEGISAKEERRGSHRSGRWRRSSPYGSGPARGDLRVCCGQEEEEKERSCGGQDDYWGPFEPKAIPLGNHEWASPRGYKRWYLEGEERRYPEEGPGEGSRGAVAGYGRATTRKVGERKAEEEERRERWKKKGKGQGSQVQPKEDEEIQEKEGDPQAKEKEQGRSQREQWRLFKPGGWVDFRRGEQQQQQFVIAAGTAAEEEQGGARSSSQDVGATCKGHLGSELAGGYRGNQGCDPWHQDELLLLPDVKTLSLDGQQGHEGVVPPVELPGSTPSWPTRSAWGQFGQSISGHTLCHDRRHMEIGAVLGTEPFGDPEFSTDPIAVAGQAACEAGSQKPRKRRWLCERPVLGMERRLGERKEKRKRRKRWKREERPWKMAAVARRLMVGQKSRAKRKGEREGGQGKGEVKRSYVKDFGPSPFDATDFEGFRELVDTGCSLRKIGIALAWLVIHGEAKLRNGEAMSPLMMVFGGQVFKEAGMTAVLRSREVLPLRLGDTCLVEEALLGSGFKECLSDDFVLRWHQMGWLYVTIRFLNHLHGCRAALTGRWRAAERVAIVSLQGCIKRTLEHDTSLQRTAFEVEKELSERFLNYTGEEVPKMETLSFDQAVVALPPKDRGGSIDVIDWVEGRTKSFLLNPADCVLSEEEVGDVKLQAKVHLVESDRMKLSCELVARGVCDWVEESDIFIFRKQRVLNGMFGVRKDAVIQDGRPVLRTIMNLIPSNAVMMQLQGLVSELPGMSQYISLTLEDGETFSLYQSDMTSAFYLFRLPSVWRRFLCFNVSFLGEDEKILEGWQEKDIFLLLLCCLWVGVVR